MRLRHRLLGLFALFAVAPLMAIGVFSHVRSVRTLESLIEARTAALSGRMARALRDQLDHLESDISLLSGNQETQALLAALVAGDSTAVRRQRPAHDQYIWELWGVMRHGYHRITLRDRRGRVVFELTTAADESAQVGVQGQTSLEPSPATTLDELVVLRPVRATADGALLGELQLLPRLRELVRGVGLDDRFGDRGWNLLLEREPARLLAGGAGQPAPEYRLPAIPASVLAAQGGSVAYEEAGEHRVGSFVSFDVLPWTILATASLDEFTAPFVRQRAVDLLLLFAVVVGVSIGFFLLLRRATRSLDQLAAAAEGVGRGDLSPALPAEAPGELGHLASAFEAMTGRIREMIAQVEAGRQTAALSRFAVELAHEIRNPLTSIKLNLQGLERDGREGLIPEESRAAVAMALREIHRLDRALHTALALGRPPAEARPFALHPVLDEAIALLRAEAVARGVNVITSAVAECDRVRGDPDALRGVFVNLLLNAIQATEPGGTIRVHTALAAAHAPAPMIEIRVRDQGPGIPAADRDCIFHPFFTTREGGTGLGLSVALQAVQAMNGSLRVSDELTEPGAELVITLPLDAAEARP